MMSTKPTTSIAPALLLVALMLFIGCSKPEGQNTNVQSSQPATSAPSQVSASTSPATTTGASPTSTGPALATADGDIPGIRVELQELKRTGGDTVTLKFAMINDSDKAQGLAYNFVDNDHHNRDFGGVGGTHLIDQAGKKKYFVVRDTENICLCSRGAPDIASKSRAGLWAKFPAPPGDVQKLTVAIPHFMPMEDVPLSR